MPINKFRMYRVLSGEKQYLTVSVVDDRVFFIVVYQTVFYAKQEGFIMTIRKISGLLTIAALSAGMLMSGCAKKVSQEDTSRLDEARSAAESAEKKLDGLRQERQDLEQQLSAKQDSLKNAGK